MTGEQRPRQEQRKMGSNDDPIGMISGKFETDIELVDEAFEVEDGVPRLTIARGKLASSKKAAAQQIAVLVAAARQAVRVEDWTESKTVEGYGKYNSPNLAAAISELEDDFSYSGKGQSRRVKVRRDGFQNAGTLVKQLLGKSEG